VNEPLPAERTLIVVHDTMWRRPLELPERLPDGCEITTDRGRLEDADAVVFHVPGLRFYHRPRKRPNQLWIAWSIESDANYPRLRDPAFMARFDLTMTYRRDADVIWGYVPYYSSADNLERALLAPPRPKDSEHPVAMLISSRVDRSGRRAYARELARHIAVDSYGRFLRNKELPDDTGRASKLELIGHYPFTIAFENSIGDDYVTEKFYDPLIAGSVPIYLGARNVAELAPAERCFLDVRDFANPRALAGHLRALLGDSAAYDGLLAWKRRPLRPEFRALLDRQRTHPWVRLCELVRQRVRARG